MADEAPIVGRSDMQTTENEVTAEVMVEETSPAKDMFWVPGGSFRMGSDNHYPEEAPSRSVSTQRLRTVRHDWQCLAVDQ